MGYYPLLFIFGLEIFYTPQNEWMNEWMNEQMNEWTNETKQTETRKVANSNSIFEIPTFKKLYFTLLLFLQFITIIISMIIIIWTN